MAAPPVPSPLPPPGGYRELRDGVAWADLGPRTSVVVAGDDAVRFVDGLCTAALARLAPRTSSEAFFLDARGQVLLWGTVFRGADGVWIDADAPPPAEGADGWSLAAHLDRYHIRERLHLTDRSGDLAWVLVAGPEAEAWLSRAGVVPPPGHDVERMEAFAAGDFPGRCAGVPAAVLRGTWGGAGSFLVVVPAADRARLVERLRDDGVAEASPAALEALRLEEGRPAPADIPPRCLPQELGRDARAIALDKGCYLGQETVARLDALGHVNRRLVGVLGSAGDAPPPGTPVEAAGESEPVGIVTSSAPSPRHGGWIGLALVRVAALRPGAAWRVAGEEARALPWPATGEAT